MKPHTFYRRLTLLTALLALLVVVLGAYVRLSAAGLGCPDWPGCYGHLTVAAAEASPTQVAANFPDRPLDTAKANKEMLHRYVAGTLGLLVFAVAAFAWAGGRRRLPPLLAGLVVFQALLGMWTVTLKLKPLVVTAHLLGGLGVLALLWWLVLDTRPVTTHAEGRRLRPFAIAGLVLLGVQMLLGGWTSSHGAGLACTGFPGCNGQWWPSTDMAAGFGTAMLDGTGLVTIQWVHRLGALGVFLYLGGLALASYRFVPRLAVLLAILLLLQVAIGIGNVLTGLPLPLAAAHNAGAALLLLALLTLTHRLTRNTDAALPGGLHL